MYAVQFFESVVWSYAILLDSFRCKLENKFSKFDYLIFFFTTSQVPDMLDTNLVDRIVLFANHAALLKY